MYRVTESPFFSLFARPMGRVAVDREELQLIECSRVLKATGWRNKG